MVVDADDSAPAEGHSVAGSPASAVSSDASGAIAGNAADMAKATPRNEPVLVVTETKPVNGAPSSNTPAAEAGVTGSVALHPSAAAPSIADNKPTRQRRASPVKDPPPLSPEELVERIRLHSPGLVEDLHSGALRAVQTEDTRESRLDGKAQGLLVTSGLSLTVAFSFGGIILQHPEYLTALESRVSGWLPVAVVAVYAIALVGGLLASVYAVRALFVSDKYRSTSDHEALDHEELLAADEEFSAEVNTNADATPRPPVDYKRANERAQLRYRRYITRTTGRYGSTIERFTSARRLSSDEDSTCSSCFSSRFF